MPFRKRVKLQIPDMYPKQRELFSATTRRSLIFASRRLGKTTGASILAVEEGIKGKNVVYLGPTAEQTNPFWASVMDMVQPLVKHDLMPVVLNSINRRFIKFPSGGSILAKTAYDIQSARGLEGDVLILDEGAILDANIYESVCRPMLLTTGGRIIIITTPAAVYANPRQNWVKALRDDFKDSPHWTISSGTAYDNPYADPVELAIAKEESKRGPISEIIFRTESVSYTHLTLPTILLV